VVPGSAELARSPGATTTSGATPGQVPGRPDYLLDTEKSNWTFDPVAGNISGTVSLVISPLNYDNPAVQEAMISSPCSGVDKGLDGPAL